MSPELHARRRLAFLGAGVGCYLLSLALSAIPGVLEVVYARLPGPAVAWLLSRVAGLVPIPLFEVLALAFVGRQLVGLARGLRDVRRGVRPWRHAVAGGALRLGQDVGVVLVLFYALWGWHYGRAPLTERLGLPDGRRAMVVEVAALAEQAVNHANTAYRALHGVDDLGKPTGHPPERAGLRDALQVGWEQAVRHLGLPASAGWRYGRPKTFLASGVLKRFGVAGMYSPFTGEALNVAGLPAVTYPKSVTHEQAHQRGIAVEAEASFVGYVVAALAPDSLARYSAHAFAVRQLLAVLHAGDPERAEAMRQQLLPGVQRDLRDLAAFWRQYEGPVADVGTRVNDAFLRSNRVEGGVQSYSLSVRLLIAYARARDGRVAPSL